MWGSALPVSPLGLCSVASRPARGLWAQPCRLQEGVRRAESLAQLPLAPSRSFHKTCSLGAKERVGEGKREDPRRADWAVRGRRREPRSLGPAGSACGGGGEREGGRSAGAPALRLPAWPPAPRCRLLARPAEEALSLPCLPPAVAQRVLSLHGVPRAAAAPRPGAGPGPCRHLGGPRQVALPAGAAAQPAPGPAPRVSRLPARVAEGQAGGARDKAQTKSRQLWGARSEGQAPQEAEGGRWGTTEGKPEADALPRWES